MSGSKWSARDGILARHVGHPMVGVDAESVACTSCDVMLLLSANRQCRLDSPVVATVRPSRGGRRRPVQDLVSGADGVPVDRFGRRPCERCGKLVTHSPAGEPVGHAIDGDPDGTPCVAPEAASPVGAPPGGWRALVAAQASADPGGPA